jgi:uncharacterized protein
MKKTFIVLTAILAILLMLPGMLCAADGVYDNAGLLSSREVEDLEDRINGIAVRYNFDLIIVTEKDIGDFDAEAYADDFFDAYGDGIAFNGALLLQVTESRDWHISTQGTGPMGGETIFNEYALTRTGDHVVKFLRADDPYGAYSSFLDDTEQYLALAEKGRSYSFLREWLWLFISITWAVSLLIAFIVVRVWKAKMNTAITSQEAAVYIVPRSLKFTEKTDKLLYNTLTKRAKPQKTASSLASSHSSHSHISSSGRSHGGRGGKY